MIKRSFKLKYFYILAASLSFILGADLIVQYNLGVDLFGFEQPEHLEIKILGISRGRINCWRIPI